MTYEIRTRYRPDGKRTEKTYSYASKEEALRHASQLKKQGWKFHIWKVNT